MFHFSKDLGRGKGGGEGWREVCYPPVPYKPLINEGLNAVWGEVGGFGLLSQSDLNEDSNEFI